MSPIERSAGGGGGSGGGAVVQVFHSQLAADAASIDTGAGAIPGAANAFLLHAKLRTDEALVATTAILTVNGDTGANYDRAGIFWSGVGVGFGSAYGAANIAMDCLGNSATANRFTTLQATFIDYADTSAWKQASSFQQEIGTPLNGNVRVHPGEAWTWRSTAVVNQVTLAPNTVGAKFKAGSSLTVYTLT